MINHLPKSIIGKLKALAIYQIIGGVLGLIITLYLIIQFPLFTPTIIFLFALAFILYTFSLICGWLLWNHYSAGVQCSLINQYLQIVQFSISGFAYTYIAGAYFSMGIDLTSSYHLLFDIGIVSTWQFNIFTSTPLVQLSFNFVAILLVVFLTYVKRDLQEEAALEHFLTGEKFTV